MALKTETNTADAESDVLWAFTQFGHEHGRISADFEHGQWWVTCLDCGAQWSVVDAEGGPAIDGFDFEQVTPGEEE